MPVYKIEFYEKNNGECPVFEFLKTLPPKIKAKIDRDIGIKEFNIKLREPLVKPLKNGIFELRTQVGAGRNELGRIPRRDDERPQI